MNHRPSIERCCAAILAGGRNSRMDGRNKALLKVGGKTILDRLLAVLEPCFSEILLVTRQPDRYADQSLTIVDDIYDDRSSLTGIHAGLVHANSEHTFVVPCDAPFLRPAMVRLLLEALDPEIDILVPSVGGHFQPLCAIYSKRCIPAIERQLDQRDYQIYRFYHQMKVKTLSEHTIKQIDPQMVSFFNVNTPAALVESQAVAGDLEDD